MARPFYTPLIPSIGAQFYGAPGLMTQGQSWFVKPYSGSDGNSGKRPDRAVKTLAKALDMATANQNDVIYMFAEGNAASRATDYQSSTLAWNKDMVHLVGVNAGNAISQRSRVAFISTYVTASNLITISANGCLFSNVQFYAGVANANPTGCMKLTGDRNHFVNCHIAGIGDDLMDSAGAYSLWFYDCSENLFEGCTIGINTVKRGTAANSEILVTTAAGEGSGNMIFRKCVITGWCESAGNYVFLKANAANALGRFWLFDDCLFYNPATAVAGGAEMTQAMQIHASANGHIILHNTTIFGAGNVNASDTGLVICGSGSVPNNAEVTDMGLALVTTNA